MPSPTRHAGPDAAEDPVGDAASQASTGRGRRGRLSRQVVLTAALALVDAEGLEALSMRRLGAVLGRDPMGLYRYATNRADLLDGITELVLGQLVIPAEGVDWQEQLRATAHDFRALALAHPHVVPLLVTRPLSTPLGLRPLGTLRPLEQILALLIDAGFAPADALHVYRAYYGFLYGHILNELQEFVVDPEENEDLLRLGLHRLPARSFPHLRALAPALADYDGAGELEAGITILLTGLTTQLHTTATSSTPTRGIPEHTSHQAPDRSEPSDRLDA
ncbi:TetR/AcrR family transcriptional regulator [Kocuria sediminis]|uniref:TetR/AcrR family transcriptional regulator n=1 Tax=Kocuria sediminis TaxID=1038857 RepID=A0A6N8GSH2_9MICC|nr:TetR/AcrR family transcriptional regulator C-terminal domain-containing protein [Kocuria sediminis]MUN63784.1 TetR/AcrR family transcriptional regulator [Kocuria sediminis]